MKILLIVRFKLTEIRIKRLIGNLSGVIDFNKSGYSFWAAGFIDGAEEKITDESHLNLLSGSSDFIEKGLKIDSKIDGVNLTASAPNTVTVFFSRKRAWRVFHMGKLATLVSTSYN